MYSIGALRTPRCTSSVQNFPEIKILHQNDRQFKAAICNEEIIKKKIIRWVVAHFDTPISVPVIVTILKVIGNGRWIFISGKCCLSRRNKNLSKKRSIAVLFS